MLRIQDAKGVREHVLFGNRPVQKGEILAFQSHTTVAYLLELLSLWLQGGISLTLDPKLPAATVQNVMQQEGVKDLLSTSDFLAPSNARESKVLHSEKITPQMNPEQPVTLIRTSGSTGEPKLAQHCWGNHFWSAKGSQENIALTPQDRWLLSLPLYHVGGLAIVVRCYLAGALLQVPDPEKSLGQTIIEYRPSHLSLVPTQLQRLMQDADAVNVLQSCRAILLGGAPVSNPLISTARQYKLPVFTSYGSTEMSSQITTTPANYWQQVPAKTQNITASGRLLPFRELRLHDQEIQVRGKTLFQGYRKQGKLHLPLTKDGWFCTRDTGCWQNGQLLVTGRLDNQFISGGENIQPEEIEGHLLSLKQVTGVMVVPVPDAAYGERPVAFVRFGQPIETADFLQWQQSATHFLKKVLPKFKWPQAYYLWPTGSEVAPALKPSRSKMKVLARTLQGQSLS